MDFEAKVCYIKENMLHVVVDVNKISINGEKLKTNDMHLTFACPEVS